MQVYLKKGDVEGRTKYFWSTTQGNNIVAILEVKTVAADVDINQIIAQTPSIWMKRDLKIENQRIDKDAAELRKELAGFMGGERT